MHLGLNENILVQFQQLVEQLKTIVYHDRNSAQEWQLGKLDYFDPSTYKSKIEVRPFPEFVQIKFKN